MDLPMPPTAIDTDGDGMHDRVCWNTWWQTTTDRQGAAGCHDVGGLCQIRSGLRTWSKAAAIPMMRLQLLPHMDEYRFRRRARALSLLWQIALGIRRIKWFSSGD